MITLFYYIVFVVTGGNQVNGTLFYNQGQVIFKPGVVDVKEGVAYAVFRDGLSTNGWGVFDVVSGYGTFQYSNEMVMYAAGFLEGALTHQ